MIVGKALRVGPDVNTDVIIPARYMQDWANLGKNVFKGESDELARRANESAFVVAGKNFGCGSSREQAVMALKQAGVQVVIAPTFARIFYRNAINLALPVLEADVDCKDGAELSVDPQTGVIRDSSGREWRAKPLPPEAASIVADGGLIEHLKRKLGPAAK